MSSVPSVASVASVACRLARSRGALLAAAVAAILVVLVAAAHVRMYYGGPGSGGRTAPDAALIQASVADVTPDMLAERQPIVLVDELVVPDHRALRKSLFRWQGVVRARERPGSAAGCTAARFTLLSCFDGASGTDVSIYPAARGELAVDVRLARGRTLVLPPRWVWSARHALFETDLYDCFSAALHALGASRIGLPSLLGQPAAPAAAGAQVTAS